MVSLEGLPVIFAKNVRSIIKWQHFQVFDIVGHSLRKGPFHSNKEQIQSDPLETFSNRFRFFC